MNDSDVKFLVYHIKNELGVKEKDVIWDSPDILITPSPQHDSR
jgi:uncharacterized protein (DUF2342 family)